MDGAACRPGIVDRGPIGALGEEQRQQGRPGDDQGAADGARRERRNHGAEPRTAAHGECRGGAGKEPQAEKRDLIASERHQPRGKAGGEAVPP